MLDLPQAKQLWQISVWLFLSSNSKRFSSLWQRTLNGAEAGEFYLSPSSKTQDYGGLTGNLLLEVLNRSPFPACSLHSRPACGLPAGPSASAEFIQHYTPGPISFHVYFSISLHQTQVYPTATRIAFAWSFPQPGGRQGESGGLVACLGFPQRPGFGSLQLSWKEISGSTVREWRSDRKRRKANRVRL